VLSRLSILEKNLTDRKISQVFIQFFDKKQEIPNVNLTLQIGLKTYFCSRKQRTQIRCGNRAVAAKYKAHHRAEGNRTEEPSK
jgi:hypothetical protein